MKFSSLATCAFGLAVAVICTPVLAITTSTGQQWDFVPDAWARGNDASTSYFGWDNMEIGSKPFHGALRVLDDATPDLGVGTTATGTRIYQGNNGIADPLPTANGHLASSGNYYSFMDVPNETITAKAPAAGAGGYTTVVLQLIASAPGGALADLIMTMDTSTNPWVLQKHLTSVNAAGNGLHWFEWNVQASSPTFSIKMTTEPGDAHWHRAVDAFQIDTYWTNGSGPAVNAIGNLIPEPSALSLIGVMAFGFFAKSRRRAG